VDLPKPHSPQGFKRSPHRNDPDQQDRGFLGRYEVLTSGAFLMTTSQHAFDQVRSILGRLDRSIDQARQKRLHGGDEPEANDATAVPTKRAEPSAPPPPAVGPARSAPPRAPSPFGRAKPLRKTQDDSPLDRWSDRGAPGKDS